MGTERSPGQASGVLVYGDPVVGEALTLLLSEIGFPVKPTAPLALDDPVAWPKLFRGIRLLLLTPRLSVEQRDGVLARLRSAPEVAHVPVIELGEPPEGAQARIDASVPWPCRIASLKRRIEDQLARTGTQPPGTKEEGA